jgi:hypothetical protein
MKHTPPPHIGNAQEVGRRKAAELRKKFPPYKIAPTNAILRIDMFSRPVNPEMLSTKSEANALARQLEKNLLVRIVVREDPGYAATDWRGEKRRVYLLVNLSSSDGYAIIEYAGFLLIVKNAGGVGAPGHFEYDGAAFGPVWVSDRKGDD